MNAVAVIPCLNEQQFIVTVVEGVKKHIEHVIVSDDASTDDTVDRAHLQGGADIVVNYSGKRGAGVNTMRGIKKALDQNASVIVTLDGDMQHNPAEIPLLLDAAYSGADLVIGSRFKGYAYMPSYRKVGNKIITWLYNMGNKNKITDSQSCYRAYNSALLRSLEITEQEFGFSTEVLIKARARGFRIVEVPISCIYHAVLSENSSKNPLSHGLQVAWCTVKWRMKIEFVNKIKSLMFSAIKATVKPLLGKGLGNIRFLKKWFGNVTGAVVSDNQIVVVNDYRMMLDVDRKRGLDGIRSELLLTGAYESLTTQVFKQNVKKGMTVVDIGANIGYYSLLASDLVGVNGKVYAIEPEQQNFTTLRKNIDLNLRDNIIPLKLAVSDIKSKGMLNISDTEGGAHSLINCREYKHAVEVDLDTLDNLFASENIDVIKCDTEGNEINVLNGAWQLIERCFPLLIIEFWADGIVASGHTAIELWMMLNDLGYQIKVIDEPAGVIGRNTLEEILARCKKSNYSVNLICQK